MIRTSCMRLATAALLVALVPAAAEASGSERNGRIVFDHDDGPIYTIDPDGTGRVQVADHGDIATWSSDGRWIALADNAPDGRVTTALVRGDGSGYASQVIPDPTLNLECAAWAPDDRRLACEGWDDVHRDRPAGLFSIRARGWDRLRRLTFNPYHGHDIAGDYSPDGERIAFARENPSLQAVAIHVLDLRSGRTRQVAPWQPELTIPSWSPDGRSLLFDSGGSLLRVSPHGGRVKPVRLESDGFAFGPAWSPDGRRIVFSLFDPATETEGIYTAKADGRAVSPVAIAPEGFFSNPDWGSR
jgi:Tol biopolymer transport system component